MSKPDTMKRISSWLLLAVLLSTALCSRAQNTRRDIEAAAVETLRQSALFAGHPDAGPLGLLVSTADVSIEMISKMPDIDDTYQRQTCLRVITYIVDSALQDSLSVHVDRVREGLMKAIDRSDDAGTRQALMEQLARCARPGDAAYFEMYLDDPQMAPTASRILSSLPGADAGTLAKADSVARSAAARPAVKPVARTAQPFWTATVDQTIARLSALPDAAADSILARGSGITEMTALLTLARARRGEACDAVLARLVGRMSGSPLTGAERYLVLRAADELAPCADVRRKIILSMGTTHCVQALAYVRQYMDLPVMADAVGVAVHDLIKDAPGLNGGRHVRNLLGVSKHSFIRHYEEEGVGEAIDDVLAAIASCPQVGYELGQTSTSMGKRGYWTTYEEMTDLDLAFDWLAEGTLTVQLRSTPAIQFDAHLGVRVGAGAQWYPMAENGLWHTANVRLVGSRLTVAVDGHEVCREAPLQSLDPETALKPSGYVSFNADDRGATVRQMCVRRLASK